MIPLDLNSFNSNQTDFSSFVLHVTFDSQIDFCIWLLELDGLQVSPFDRHPNGNRILQGKGIILSCVQR
jgi:hypothetical protein